MANTLKGWGQIADGTGTWYANVDTTADFNLGQAATSNAGSFIVQVTGTGFTGSIKPKLSAPGSAGLSLSAQVVGLVNLDTFAEIAGSTGITGDGLYRFTADHGMLVTLSVTVAAGSVKILIRKGDG